jgi:hypothetical protein
MGGSGNSATRTATHGSRFRVPDSGHGGIFQFHDEFAPVVVEFLDR